MGECRLSSMSTEGVDHGLHSCSSDFPSSVHGYVSWALLGTFPGDSANGPQFGDKWAPPIMTRYQGVCNFLVK